MKRLFGFLKSCRGLMSPRGLEVVTSAGNEKSEKLNFFDNETVEFEETSEPVLMFKECGHRGSQKFRFNIWGNVHGLKIKEERITKKNGEEVADGICPKCYFERMRQSAIRCCLCGHAILPGDGVALYHKSSKGINKAVATFVGDSAVGCLLWDCCPSGGFFAGHWTHEGFKPAFASGTAAEEAMTTGKTVISNV